MYLWGGAVNKGGGSVHFSGSSVISLGCILCFSSPACPIELAWFPSLPACLGLLIIPETPQAFLCQRRAFHGRKGCPATPAGAQRAGLRGAYGAQKLSPAVTCTVRDLGQVGAPGPGVLLPVLSVSGEGG